MFYDACRTDRKDRCVRVAGDRTRRRSSQCP
jgi:hypothetical protein